MLISTGVVFAAIPVVLIGMYAGWTAVRVVQLLNPPLVILVPNPACGSAGACSRGG